MDGRPRMVQGRAERSARLTGSAERRQAKGVLRGAGGAALNLDPCTHLFTGMNVPRMPTDVPEHTQGVTCWDMRRR